MYYTTKSIAKLNQISESELDDLTLRLTSSRLGYEVKLVPDTAWGAVNKYHIDVWRQCYPDLMYYEAPAKSIRINLSIFNDQ